MGVWVAIVVLNSRNTYNNMFLISLTNTTTITYTYVYVYIYIYTHLHMHTHHLSIINHPYSLRLVVEHPAVEGEAAGEQLVRNHLGASSSK